MKPYTAHDFRDTTIDSGFWKNRQEINAKVTIHNVYKRFSDTGRFDAFRCDWREGMPNKPHYFWDSDVAKWLESVAYIREKNECPDLERIVDDVVDRIEQNQDESGYFNIYFTVVEPEQRWQRRTDHELYCAGHLMEAAVAYHIATGKNKFLNLMRKCADHIEKVFMIDNSAAFTTCGHEEIELALIKLYKATGEPRYLHLAEFFLDSRGQRQEQAYDWTTPLSDQSHLPVREQFTAQGHCVRALYLYIAMADLARLTGDEALLTACKALFDDIIRHKMYITGGVGSSRLGEAFTIPYDLPNLTAYAETCAAIALIFFCNRMQSLLIDSKYADTAERALYNGFLSGVSLDGKSFFYENPLELDPRLIQKDASVKNKTRFAIPRRVEVFDCSCCPPNVTRLIASVADHLYTYDEQTIFIHHFMSGVSQLGASGVKITQQTDYPKNGKITLTVQGGAGRQLAVRVPGWCHRAQYQTAPAKTENGYAYFTLSGDEATISVEFVMRPRILQADPRVHENSGRVAVEYGPFVYCAEEADNGKNLRDIQITSDISVEFDDLWQVNILRAKAYRSDPDRYPSLYREMPADDDALPFTCRLIPYFCFANREEGEMLVWLGYRR